MVNKEKDKLEKQIEEIVAVIEETKKRLPAHSTKPPIMMELLDLEDQYDRLLERLRKIEMDNN